MSFAQLGLTEALLNAISEQGYTNPTPVQEKTIPVILEGKDVLAGAQTGTGKTASSAQAQEMHAHIRSVLAGKYGKATADEVSILYGGSVKGSNAAELFAQPDVDGGLVGGASLVAAEFCTIMKSLK